MKLLVLTTGYPRFEGDIFGHFIKDLLVELPEEVSVTVLAPHEDGLSRVCWESERIKVVRPRYFPLRERVAYGSGIPQNIRHGTTLFQLPFFMVVMWFWAWRLGRGADIVHAHWGIPGLWGCLSRRRRQASVVTFRGSDLHSSKWLLKISRWVALRTQARIVVSGEQREQLAPLPVYQWANPIPSPFSPANMSEKMEIRKRRNWPLDEPLFFFAGQLTVNKGLDFLLEALALVERGCLVVAGEGEELEGLMRREQQLGLRGRIFWLGAQPTGDMPDLFRACDLLLMASDREGRPNVLVQGMACGLPSLSTAVGGIPEMIDDGVEGFLLDKKTERYAARIAELLSDDQLRVEMGLRARRRFESFGQSVESLVKQHLELYKELMCQSK